MPLDLRQDVALLTAEIIDFESVSGAEKNLADAIEEALHGLPWLKLWRDGDAIIARTEYRKAERVILAGHIDTVPLPTRPGALGTVPAQWRNAADAASPKETGTDVLYGRGAVDMKSGVAVQLALSARAETSNRDITFVFYDHEEVEAVKNGLGRLVRNHRNLLNADFGILLEPSNATIEGGCNGTMRFEARVQGKTAHSARAWMGQNAIHETAELLLRLRDYEPQTIRVDGLDYREGLNAVRIRGGIAGNVIPDESVVEINYRFAPDKTIGQAEALVQKLLAGFDIRRTDAAPAARPGLENPIAVELAAIAGGTPVAKLGWTDVAKLAELGIPAVNFGPGDPLLAHSDNEHVAAEEIRSCLSILTRWLIDPR